MTLDRRPTCSGHCRVLDNPIDDVKGRTPMAVPLQLPTAPGRKSTGGVTYHIEGELFPVLHIELTTYRVAGSSSPRENRAVHQGRVLPY